MDEIVTRNGFTKLGMEKVGTLMTRGVLIDIAGLKGVDILPIDYEITVADLEQALLKQGLSLQRGDAVLIYTGWSKHWGVDNKLYMSGCPGIGVAAAEWLIKQDPMLLGSDNWPVEVAPNPDKIDQSAGPQHRTHRQWRSSAREPGAGGPRQGTCLRVRVHYAAA
jgi:kynurenine formamidase